MSLIRRTLKTLLIHSTATLSLIGLSASLQADDVEIYRANGSGNVQPNVMFIFDTSGSMGSDSGGGDNRTRMDVAKEAAISIIGDTDTKNINFGLARFDTTESGVYPVNGVDYFVDKDQYPNGRKNYRDGGGFIQVPAKDINDPSHRQRLLSAIDGLETNAWTPLVETYDETIRYLLGEPVHYGKKYGKTECSAPGFVTVQAPDRIEEVRECQYCSLRGESPSNCRALRWSWRRGLYWETGTVSTVNNNYCESRDYRRNPQFEWTVVDTITIPGETYEEWRDGGCYETGQPQYFYLSNSETYNPDTGNYISPIQNSCQKNHIVIFTDGESTWDSDSDARIRTKLSSMDAADRNGIVGITTNCSTASSDQLSDTSCIEELSLYSYMVDQFDDATLALDPNPDTEEIQRITTHTIGAFLGDGTNISRQLERTANLSNGMYRLASNSGEIRDTLRNLFETINEDSLIGNSSPAVAVNALNRLESSEELYYTVFEPKSTKGWSGNLKRYKLGRDGKVKDANNQDAVDPDTGYFSTESKSLWTEGDPDGRDVTKGGIANEFEFGRKIVTYTGSGDGKIDDPLVSEAGGVYSIAAGIPTDIFNADLNLLEVTEIYKWGAGIAYDEDGNEVVRAGMEDPLHSEPLLIHYGDTENYDNVIYFGTNSGYLHAIDTDLDNPQEKFSYIPVELLGNLEVYYREGAEVGKQYGLDGAVTAFIYNESELKAGSKSRRTIVGPNEKAYLYMGMRRGGGSYYALDVTDPDNPKHLWQISSADEGLARLGQTWSALKPIFVSPKAIGLDSDERDAIPVLVFGGGYDVAEDDTSNSARIDHSVGNAIFMVDALTGELLWSASPDSDATLQVPGMKSAIASDITPLDNDGNGTVDILYAADLGGRIWRIDLMSTGDNFATELADLNGGDVANNTRFFTTPAVSYHDRLGSYVINLGSGYRAHPLVENNQDRMFVVFDSNTSTNEVELLKGITAHETIELDDLANYANFAAASEEEKRNGFFYEFEYASEKALTDSITADNVIYVSTYSPQVAQSQASGLEGCTPATGSTRLYSLDISSYDTLLTSGGGVIGGPNDTGSDKPELTTIDLKQTGIPAKPTIVFPPSENSGDDGDDAPAGGLCDGKAILIGSESVCLEGGDRILRNFWREL